MTSADPLLIPLRSRMLVYLPLYNLYRYNNINVINHRIHEKNAFQISKQYRFNDT